MKVVLISHSPDGKKLYGCVISKKPAAAAAAAGKKAPAAMQNSANVEADLDSLISYQINSMDADHARLERITKSYLDSGRDYGAIRQELNNYLQPILKSFMGAAESSRVATPVAGAKAAKGKEKEKKPEDDMKHYVFISDEQFSALPLVECFKFSDAKCTTTDLSVPILLQRLAAQSGASAAAAGGKGAAVPSAYGISKEAVSCKLFFLIIFRHAEILISCV